MPNEQLQFIERYINKPFKINNVIQETNKENNKTVPNQNIENIFKQTKIKQKRPDLKILNPEQKKCDKANNSEDYDNYDKTYEYFDYLNLKKNVASNNAKKKKNYYDEKEAKKFLYSLRSHKTPNDLPYEACSTGFIDSINSINNCNTCILNISNLEYRSGGPMGCGPI